MIIESDKSHGVPAWPRKAGDVILSESEGTRTSSDDVRGQKMEVPAQAGTNSLFLCPFSSIQALTGLADTLFR